MVTDARLRELALSDTDDGPEFLVAGNLRMRTRLVDGEIWRALGSDDWTRPAAGAPDADEFRAWLRGDPEGRRLDRSDVARAMAGTPLVARGDSESLVRAHGPVRAPRGILADWRERARAALVACVGDDLAIVGGIPMARMRGPLAYFKQDARTFRIARFPGSRTADEHQARGIFLRVDRVRSMSRLLRIGAPVGDGPWTQATFAGAAFRRDDDVEATLASGVRLIAMQSRSLGIDRAAPEAEAALRDVEALSPLAGIGFAPEDLSMAAAALGRLFGAMDEGARPFYGPVGDLRAYLKRIAWPLIGAGRPVPACDVDALAGMAP